MNFKQIVICANNELKRRNLGAEYKKRLKFEIGEIIKQGAMQYWESIYGEKFDNNPNKLLLPYLLGMVEEDPMATRKDPVPLSTDYKYINDYIKQHGSLPCDIKRDPDMPDIDIDCLPEARDHIKKYAMQKYGTGNDEYGSVCSVGTWQAYKFKSALVDVAAALGTVTKQEVYELTTKLPDTVDDLPPGGRAKCQDCNSEFATAKCPCGSDNSEGLSIGMLLDEHENLREFASKHKKIVSCAVRMIGKIRNRGMHAGAIIISSKPLFGNIPLAPDTSRGYWTSLWSEGRNTQLSRLGYVKWDVLGLKTLKYIYEACRMIKNNRKIIFGDLTGRKVYKIRMKSGEEKTYRTGDIINIGNKQMKIEDFVVKYRKAKNILSR